MSMPGNADPFRASRRSAWIVTLLSLSILTLICIAQPAQAQVIRSFNMRSPSMEPTIRQGERILASPSHYRNNAPARGDVVIYRHPQRAGEVWIKRIAAVAGDRVAVREGRAIVNGMPAAEPYVLSGGPGAFFNTMAEITVPDGHVFVLGDNRANSMDSRARQHGPVPVANLEARATGIAFSRDIWRIGRWIGTPSP
ncbi:MAG: signal peptidase I [Xanthobacteraceae bacterium]